MNANAFALLDDEGTLDAGVLAAKLPVKEVTKPGTDAKQGESELY